MTTSASRDAGSADVVAELTQHFGQAAFTPQDTLTGMPVIWVAREQLRDVLAYLRRVTGPFSMLFDLSAVDERLRTHRRGLPPADFTVFYQLLSVERNADLMIKVALHERDLMLPSISDIFINANWYEREVFDLFGIDFAGHPHLTRIMMPPTWTGPTSVGSCCRAATNQPDPPAGQRAIAARMAGPYGARNTPTSVTMPSISSAGVTSNAGLNTRAPIGVMGLPPYSATSAAGRCSISMAAPSGVSTSIVDRGAAT